MLDGRKLARMATNRARMRQGRMRTVTLLYRRPEGDAYLAVEAVWRAQPYAEPAAAERPAAEVVAARAEFPLDVDPRLIALVADTPLATAEAVAGAARYAVLRYRAAGIAANRWIVELGRLR